MKEGNPRKDKTLYWTYKHLKEGKCTEQEMIERCCSLNSGIEPNTINDTIPQERKCHRETNAHNLCIECPKSLQKVITPKDILNA